MNRHRTHAASPDVGRGKEAAVDRLGDVGQQRREQLERRQQRSVERVARRLIPRRAAVEPLLGHLQVVVGQIAPEEGLDLGAGRGVVVIVERRRDRHGDLP